jgi:uncharacterized protein
MQFDSHWRRRRPVPIAETIQMVNTKSVLRWGSLLLALHCALSMHAAAAAQNGDAKIAADGTVVELLDTQERTMTSAAGKEYRIFTAIPTEQAPPQGWPVVYVLDGNAWFALMTQQSRLMARRPDKGGVIPAVIVGIGYPGNRPFHTERRTWDFTPEAPVRAPVPAPGGRPWSPTGGADEFMRFVQSELKPAIESEFKIDRGRQVLFGHSLGGLFVLHALFAHPQSFQHFVSASPSVWWNDRYILEEARSFAANVDKQGTDRSLLIAFGAEELPEMVADPKTLYEQIQPLTARGLRLQMKEIAEEEHVSVAIVAFNRLMRFALATTPEDRAYYSALYAPRKADSPVQVPPLPTARSYLKLSADERYELRMQVRGLPKEQRDAFNAKLYDLLQGPISAAARKQLHQERIVMDKRHGTVPVED